ncbi:ABC transporter ATP-binding protein [Staphylococcus simulans]|uniref:ABC transporter ATP-binding protein n=1 Tax=Staphylococcus simulans TaxID=1286 RepID=UPI0007107747|nr:ABC transporter ATP-binding protein [Staphylococcus simulans]PTI94688.1 ABC transporter ATP-binding protein [Staphylococcus simulans]PTJ03340.1 ABC transporter ATP-binding protein [Staphylococcus simulans]PTJ10410.1 ABC transporter ATP-binding protein [Staphylococcus simulans]PTJ38594.1 ABC transporter ATP-binding protein [Staphylococcus simulans]PTJ97799.1 ABC transporter ATP-binding protein [Staphylococcus simulans]
MIKVNGVTKSFHNTKAIDHVSFEIKEGECIALIGVNGAGKSTLIDLILGNLVPDEGRIERDSAIQNNISVLFQKSIFNEWVKVKELYAFYSSVYKKALDYNKFKTLTQFTDKQLNQYATKLSGGQQRLLDFILMLTGQPLLIFLDEPTSAMDAKTRRYFWNIINDLKARGITILYTTHYIEEVEKVADRVIVLKQGKIMNDSSPSQLKHLDKTSTIYLPEQFESIIQNQTQLSYQKDQSELQIKTDEVQKVLQQLIEIDIDLNELEIKKSSLEDYVFESEGEILS